MGYRKFGVWELNEWDPDKVPPKATKVVVRFDPTGYLGSRIYDLINVIRYLLELHEVC